MIFLTIFHTIKDQNENVFKTVYALQKFWRLDNFCQGIFRHGEACLSGGPSSELNFFFSGSKNVEKNNFQSRCFAWVSEFRQTIIQERKVRVCSFWCQNIFIPNGENRLDLEFVVQNVENIEGDNKRVCLLLEL